MAKDRITGEGDDKSPKKSKESIEERAVKWIAEAQEKYSVAITEAREAAATTMTTAWMDNYRAQRAIHDKLVRDTASAIANAAKRVIDFDTTEDDEKEIKDAVKALQEERIRYAAWKSRAVSPYQSKAERCNEILDAVSRDASNLEQQQGLVWFGIVSAIGDIIAKWPTAQWDSKTGVVSVKEPPAQAQQVVNQ